MPSTRRAETPSLIAAIDLGSNSFHMVLAKADHGEIRILERLGDRCSSPPAWMTSACSARKPCSAASTACAASPR